MGGLQTVTHLRNCGKKVKEKWLCLKVMTKKIVKDCSTQKRNWCHRRGAECHFGVI